MLIVLKILRLLIISLVYHLDLNILQCFRTAKAKKIKRTTMPVLEELISTWVLFFFFFFFFFRKARFKILWPWLLSVDLDIGSEATVNLCQIIAFDVYSFKKCNIDQAQNRTRGYYIQRNIHPFYFCPFSPCCQGANLRLSEFKFLILYLFKYEIEFW